MNGLVDETLVISRLDQRSETDDWRFLTAAPSEEEYGFYWLVTPEILHYTSHPDYCRDTGVDLTKEGTWAVKERGIDSSENASFAWLFEHDDEKDGPKEMKLLSRSIKPIPSPPWKQPLHHKTVLVQGIQDMP